VFFSAVAQRRREVGVLRALGFGRLTIIGSFLAESALRAARMDPVVAMQA
jgi:ABC-type antimicrobial peptide transport system permease subunit